MKKIIIILFVVQFLSCQGSKKEHIVVKEEALREEVISEIKEDVIPFEQSAKTIEEKFVIAKSGLNYREEPKGEIVGKFNFNEKIQIVAHTNVFETIKDNGFDKRGEWLGVQLNNDTVYVFGAYLAMQKKVLKPLNSIEILLPSVYRDWDNENEVDVLNKNWVDLNKKGTKYYIDKANYTIERGEDECSGSLYKAIKSKNETLIFIKNEGLGIGEVYSQNFKKDKIWPNEKESFDYKEIKYTIRAEGDILSDEEVHTDNGLERYCKVKNYKLYIATEKIPESIFLEEKSFSDTFVKLLFVGDIDGDDKLDFIFEANRDYEEERVILYLSSKADKNKVIKKVAETSLGFDC